MNPTAPRVSRAQVAALFERPLMDLLYEAQTVHRRHHDPNRVQLSTLLSVKTGGCPEDCGYCAQSARFKTGLAAEPMLPLDQVLAAAKTAREGGSTRFCMGAAWRKVADRDLPKLEEMVREVRALGLETCMTLGTLSPEQAERLKGAGLDYYNHNLDTSRDRYGEVVTTRGYDERLGTLSAVRQAGIKVCCGGILGLGETREDRINFLCELANLPAPPESVPINALVPVEGTPMAEVKTPPVDPLEFVRAVAVARILMPESMVRLSAGRESMPEAVQALCFFAGANSIFTGERLLTTPNRGGDQDREMLARLGMEPA